jgi:hypothetical protein
MEVAMQSMIAGSLQRAPDQKTIWGKKAKRAAQRATRVSKRSRAIA